MDKRRRFVAELRKEAKARNLVFQISYSAGKGGHAVVWVGSRWTTLSSRDPDPKTMAKIKKHLGLD